MKNQGALPAYVQISELLIREISAGHLLVGERLPPERQLASEMRVSVGTLRKALSELQKKGLLERRQGSGNYVSGHSPAEAVYAFFRIELHEGGGLPTARVLSVERLPKPADLPEFGSSGTAHRIRRLRFLNQQPVVLEEIWLDGSVAEQVTAAELSESLYLFYKQRLGLWITRAEDRIGLGPVPDWAPAEFSPRIGETCGLVERISWAQDNQTAEFSRSWFDAEKARYVTRIK